MKFRLCGDSDCPDWILYAINADLSILTAVRLKNMSLLVAKNISVKEMPEQTSKDMLPASNSKENRSLKSMVSCLRFLLLSAARLKIDEITLSAELQQIGLPKEHAGGLYRAFAENAKAIRESSLNRTIKIHHMLDVSHAICSSGSAIEPKVKTDTNSGKTHTIYVHKTNLSVIINELKVIRDLVNCYSYKSMNHPNKDKLFNM